jgi:hypothetical protein
MTFWWPARVRILVSVGLGQQINGLVAALKFLACSSLVFVFLQD